MAVVKFGTKNRRVKFGRFKWGATKLQKSDSSNSGTPNFRVKTNPSNTFRTKS